MNISRYFDKLKTTSVTPIIILGIVGFGIILRIAQYAANGSLWLDEALLALNIVDRSFIELMQPLNYNQGAPIGFLFIEKFAIQILGNTDYVFRLFPFVAGIASLLVMYKIASIFLDTTGKIVATGSFAISGKLVYYTSQAKQYSSDALISLLLLFVAYKCLESKIYKPRYIALIVSGVVSMWISHPSLFMLVGVSSGLALDQLIRPDRRRVNWLGITFLIWTVNFVILYFVSLRSLAANSALLDYWRNAFMPMPPWRGFAWILNAFPAMFENPVGLVGPLTASIGMVVFLAGCISFFFKKRQLALFLIVPFPIVFLASGLQKYPFGDRLLLFIVPIVLLLIGEGIEVL
jgi:hypothetical protein